MPRRGLLFVLVLSALLYAATGSLGAQSRIAGSVDRTNIKTLHGSIHPMTQRATDVGRMDGNAMLHGIILNFNMTAPQKTSLDTLVQEQRNPASPQYHRWLTPSQFAALFGTDPQDIDTVSSWLQSQGFAFDHVAESQNAISFSGAVRQVEQAFQTEVHKYTLNGENHFANASELNIPGAFSGIISSIHGLNDFRPTPKNIRMRVSNATTPSPLFTSGITGSHYLVPGDIATIYDINPLYNSGVTGSGQTIGVMGQTDIIMSDIQSFRSAAGLSLNNPSVYLIPGSADPGIGYNSDLPEADTRDGYFAK